MGMPFGGGFGAILEIAREGSPRTRPRRPSAAVMSQNPETWRPSADVRWRARRLLRCDRSLSILKIFAAAWESNRKWVHLTKPSPDPARAHDQWRRAAAALHLFPSLCWPHRSPGRHISRDLVNGASSTLVQPDRARPATPRQKLTFVLRSSPLTGHPPARLKATLLLCRERSQASPS